MEVVSEFIGNYRRQPKVLRLIDVFTLFSFITGILQLVYVAMVGTFPFNSFLSGFLACVGNFVLLVSLRMQVNKDNEASLKTSPERAFGEFLFCQVILHFAVIAFIG